MTKDNKAIDYAKHLEAINDKPRKYWLKRIAPTDSLVMTKNGEPVLVIPESLRQDFIDILSRFNASEQMFKDKEQPENDIPASLYCKDGSKSDTD